MQTPALPLGYVAGKRQSTAKGYRERRAAANTPTLLRQWIQLANRGALNDAPAVIGVSGQEEANILAERPALEGLAI